jgi:hypothetical protein
VLLGLPAIAPTALTLAAAEVAVRDKRAHDAGLGERQWAVVALSVLDADRGGDATVETDPSRRASARASRRGWPPPRSAGPSAGDGTRPRAT